MLGTLSRFDKLKVLSQSMGLSKRFEKRSRVPISGRAIRSPEPVEWGEGWLKLRSALFASIRVHLRLKNRVGILCGDNFPTRAIDERPGGRLAGPEKGSGAQWLEFQLDA
jgi:hypothetical protein